MTKDGVIADTSVWIVFFWDKQPIAGPSLGGRSHVPQEDTPWSDIEKGAKVLFAAVERFAK